MCCSVLRQYSGTGGGFSAPPRLVDGRGRKTVFRDSLEELGVGKDVDIVNEETDASRLC